MPYLSPTQSQIMAAVRSVLLAILPAGMEVVQSQQNLVPEPLGSFVMLTPVLRTRLATNADEYQDCAFVGSIVGTVLTVSKMTLGTIQPSLNPSLFGPTVAAGTAITAQTGGTPGGAGTYTVSVAQTLASGPLAAGVLGMKQAIQLTVQADIHGPASPDNAQLVSTVFRSAYGTGLFAAQGVDATCLYTSDPREQSFSNAESQIEWTWGVDLILQANQVVSVPQQFFDQIQITLQPPVDAAA